MMALIPAPPVTVIEQVPAITGVIKSASVAVVGTDTTESQPEMLKRPV
jgi:hypothetical protein